MKRLYIIPLCLVALVVPFNVAGENDQESAAAGEVIEINVDSTIIALNNYRIGITKNSKGDYEYHKGATRDKQSESFNVAAMRIIEACDIIGILNGELKQEKEANYSLTRENDSLKRVLAAMDVLYCPTAEIFAKELPDIAYVPMDKRNLYDLLRLHKKIVSDLTKLEGDVRSTQVELSSAKPEIVVGAVSAKYSSSMKNINKDFNKLAEAVEEYGGFNKSQTGYLNDLWNKFDQEYYQKYYNK